MRLLNNDHFKYTTNTLNSSSEQETESVSSKIDHLLKTNAALSLMSKINLVNNLNSRNSSMSKISSPSPSLNRLSLNMTQSGRSVSYFANTRPKQNLNIPSQLESDLKSQTGFIKRSFAPPSSALNSLLKSGTEMNALINKKKL